MTEYKIWLSVEGTNHQNMTLAREHCSVDQAPRLSRTQLIIWTQCFIGYNRIILIFLQFLQFQS